MDEFIEAMEGFISGAKQTYSNWPYKKKPSNNWVECYKLWKAKWRVEDYLEVENSDDVLVRWTDGNNKRDVRMTYSDQVIWLQFLEKQEKSK